MKQEARKGFTGKAREVCKEERELIAGLQRALEVAVVDTVDTAVVNSLKFCSTCYPFARPEATNILNDT